MELKIWVSRCGSDEVSRNLIYNSKDASDFAQYRGRSTSPGSAFAMSANSSRTGTTTSHTSAQTHITIPGSIQSSDDYDPNDISKSVYYYTEKNCSKSFTRRSDWIRHEETHWLQQLYLYLYCIPEGHIVDGSY
jgi:hypothetical protein